VTDHGPDGEVRSQQDAADTVARKLGETSSGLALRELGELAQALLATSTVDGVLHRVALATRHLVPAADLVSMTLRRPDGDLHTPVTTDPEAVALDELQYDTGEGPCIDAARPQGIAYAHSGDLAAESAWPAFAAKAAEDGYLSILSTALLNNPEPSTFTGALNIYSRQRDGFDDTARDTAFLLATYASLALAAAHRTVTVDHALAVANNEALNLRKALDTRTVIGQATGILMARRGLTADEAFKVLSRASQNHNVRLAELAHILTTHPGTADRI
jgi:hypothetical protein